MRFTRGLLVATALLALSAPAAAADHGRAQPLPPDGVVFADPSDWDITAQPSPGCRRLDTALDGAGGLGYGLRLDRDYEHVIVEGHPLPLAATEYDKPQAGEWVWHDENANSRFDQGEDAAYAVYLCGKDTGAGLPPTDAAPPSYPQFGLFLLLTAVVTCGLSLMRRNRRIE